MLGDVTSDVGYELRLGLANSLVRNNQRSASDLVEAAGLLKGLVSEVDPLSENWTGLQMRLGLVHLALSEIAESSRDNLRIAITHYELALDGQIPDSAQRASVAAQAAYALLRLDDGSREDIVARARRHLENALAVFTEGDYPEERQEVLSALASIDGPPEQVPATATIVEAAESGWILRVRELLASGVDINTRDAEGRTALQVAIAEGHCDLVSFLLAHGADPTLVDAKGFSLLHWAVFSDDPALIALGHVASVGVDPRDVSGRTPLSWAASQDSLHAVEWLIAAGADLELADDDGWTPLHYAVALGRFYSVTWLVDSGANRDARSVVGETPLDLALRLEKSAIVKALSALPKS